jgi:hypothetical protein
MVTTSYDSGARPDGRGPLGALQDGARTAVHDVREQGNAHFESYRDSAADQLDALAEGARSAAEQIGARDELGVSHYIADMASSMGSLAEGLRGKSADQLLHQAGRLARDNPALFLAGSVAVGFGLSRLLRASTSHERPFIDDEADYGVDYGSDWTGAEVSPVIAADEGVPLTPPHTDDTFANRPGTPAGTTTRPVTQPAPLTPDSLNDGNPNKGDLE